MFSLTAILRLRAVRTFMQLGEVGTSRSGEAVAADLGVLSQKPTDIARACRITNSLLKLHLPRQDPARLKSDPRNAAEGASENAVIVNRARKASAWADASGKAAYLTHVAHQQRFDESNTTDLVNMVNRTWASWDTKKKVNWVMVAPQGQRALRLLADTDRRRTPEKGLASEKHGLGSSRRVPPRIGKEESKSPLLPSSPSAAAVSCKPAKRRHLMLQDWGQSPPAHAAQGPSHTRKQGFFDTAVDSSDSSGASRHLSVSRLRQRNRWKRELNQMLGGNDSRTFQGSIKEHQQEYEDTQVSAQPILEATKTSNTDIFLNLCDDMNIGSPRKAFVLQKMIPFLNSNERDVGNGSVAPLSLAEVKIVAQKFSQEFDQHRKDILKSCGSSSAVQTYEKALIEEELTQVRWKLDQFQSKVPLLQRIANLCMGL